LAWLDFFGAGSLEFLKTALPTSLLAYQFFDWWYSSDVYKQSTVLPIPSPPEALPVHVTLTKIRFIKTESHCQHIKSIVHYVGKKLRIQPPFIQDTCFAIHVFIDTLRKRNAAQ
jgi:hypothetical protein